MRNRTNRAFTLLETLVTIIVLAVAGSALLGVYTSLVARSADPIVREQALAIAEAYMEEIRLKPFNDPDVPPDDAEAARNLFDDVEDYDGLIDDGARDQNGNLIIGLEDYDVEVTVDGAVLAGVIADTQSYLIEVEVDHPAIDPILLKSFRVNY